MASSNEPQPIYEPLQGRRGIRLLKFVPRNRPDDPISTELKCFDLDSESCPSYWALSYTWGSPFPSHSPTIPPLVEHEIICNGHPFLVGNNLYSFMNRFGGGNYYYWIDAVCINQKDLDERSAQVRIMVWIYTKAVGTFIWLGEEDEAAKRSHEVIIKFVEAKRKLGEAYNTKILDRRWEFNEPAFFEAMSLEPWSNEDWKAILDFYARPWFYRQWVVQEVVVQVRFVVFCGNRGMEWPNFISFTQFFIAQSCNGDRWNTGLKKIESEFHEVGAPTGIEATYLFVGLVDRKREGPAKKSTQMLLGILSDYRTDSERFDAFVLYNVSRMRGRAATDPADHVYAPLSLASRFQGDVDTLPPIDYRLTTAQIYTKFSAHLMRGPRPMVLGFREDDTLRQIKDLPSWVPDYSAWGHHTPLSMRKAYNACGEDSFWPYSEALMVQNGTFHTRGVFVDRVLEVTNKLIPEYSAETLFDLVRLAYNQDPTLTLESRLESLMRTICANIVEDHVGVSKDDIFSQFANWFRLISLNPEQRSRLRESMRDLDTEDWARFWVFGKEPLNPPPGQESHIFPEVEAWKNSEDLSRFLSRFISLGKRLALTETRRALALAPLSTRPGDEVWILFNGRTPYILRRIDGLENCYHFVGEAYVHGFMYGEQFSRDIVIQPVLLI